MSRTSENTSSRTFVNKEGKDPKASLDDQGEAVDVAVDVAVAVAAAVDVAVAVAVDVAVAVAGVVAGTVFSTVVSTVFSTVTLRGGGLGPVSS